ncbi:hypothetical protein FQR65_LT15194 [Abscondita terminalis]|nr:hypothetical protein FQR65_LT15194 [Abscondita terminalis]
MPTDSLRIIIEDSGNTLLNLSLLSGFEIQRYLGTAKVGPALDNNADILKLKLLSFSANKKKLMMAPFDQPFDRVQISYGDVVNVNLDQLNFTIPATTISRCTQIFYTGCRQGCEIGPRQEIEVLINPLPVVQDVEDQRQMMLQHIPMAGVDRRYVDSYSQGQATATLVRTVLCTKGCDIISSCGSSCRSSTTSRIIQIKIKIKVKNNAIANGVDVNTLRATIVDEFDNPIAATAVDFSYTSLVTGSVVTTQLSTDASANGVDKKILEALIVDAFDNPIVGAAVVFGYTDLAERSVRRIRAVDVSALVAGTAISGSPQTVTFVAALLTMAGNRKTVDAQVANRSIANSPAKATFVIANHISVTKVADQARVKAGTSTSFTITLTNDGPETLAAGKVISLTERPGAGVTITGYTVPAVGGTIVVKKKPQILQQCSGGCTNVSPSGTDKNTRYRSEDDKNDTDPMTETVNTNLVSLKLRIRQE